MDSNNGKLKAMNYKVTIVIPAYNAEGYISRTLDSVINQTYKNLEVIIVNDGSIDNTSQVVRSHLKESSLDWKVIDKANGGQASARNTGILNAKGDYISFLDSDDYINPNYIEILLSSLIKTDSDFAACPFQNVYEKDFEREPNYNKDIKVYETTELSYLYLHRKIVLIAPALLIKKEVTRNVLFDDECPYDEDGLFVWSILYNTAKGVYCNIPLYNYRIREGSVMRSLTVEKCHKSIVRYSIYCEQFKSLREDNVSSMIYPNYKLASQHVLAKNVKYGDFMEEYNRIKRTDMYNLISLKDIKLSMLSLLYIHCPVLFYCICKRL
jgi:glycosyltransferase involved in cell wall biosynthesis